MSESRCMTMNTPDGSRRHRPLLATVAALVAFAAVGCRLQPDQPLPQVLLVFDTASEDATGIQAALLTDFAARNMTGAQIGGVVNYVEGQMAGAQVALVVNNAEGGVRGAQVALLVNMTEDEASGVQAGLLLGNTAGEARGVQLGASNRARRLAGWQAGIINQIAPGLEGPAGGGVQLGAVNLMRPAWQEKTGSGAPRREFSGAQVGVFNYSRVRLAGVQSGAVNYLDSGACQVGVVNWAGRCGVQTGIVNVSRAAEAGEWQFGVLNVMAGGFLPVCPVVNYRTRGATGIE